MQNAIELGCERCGCQIMRPNPVPVNKNIKRISIAKCKDCNYETDVINKKIGYQCSPTLLSFLKRFCSYDELKQLRIDPKNFIKVTLNDKLAEADKNKLEVDLTKTPPVIYEKK